MNKVILILAFIAIGFNANAQFNKDYTEFRLGEYTFLASDGFDTELYRKLSGGQYTLDLNDRSVANAIDVYIKMNKDIIEKEYNVVISGSYSILGDVIIIVTDASTEFGQYVKKRKEKAPGTE